MSRKSYFRNLFTPGQIGKMTIRNRTIMSPMGTKHPTEDGFVTEPMKVYYEERASGGVGLIVTEATVVDFPEGGGLTDLCIHDDKYISGLSQLVEAIHRGGAKAAAQLTHLGPASVTSSTGMQPVAASALARQPDYTHPSYADYRSYGMPRELSIDEIKAIVGRFARGVERARNAGYDGVEINACHRYLLNSFISPAWNRRQDEYGGDLRNRARILLEIISSARKLVGRDFPLWCRINSEERDIDGGTTLAMARELARMLEDAGADAICVTCNFPHSPGYAPGFNIDQAASIKKAVGLPIIVVGRLDPRLGERTLRHGKADFICFGRSLIADAGLVNKAASGRLEDIRPCVYCCSCLGTRSPMCTVNPSIAEGQKDEVKPAPKVRRVMVVGGGPGGMEAARVAALRGHQVTLYEKGNRLGGQLLLASVLRKENEALVKYLTTQIKKLGVKIELEKEVDAPLVAGINPDVVVLATGATSSLPQVPGVNGANVLTAADIHSMVRGNATSAPSSGRVRWRRYVWRLGASVLKVFGPPALRLLLRFSAPFGERIIVVGLGLPGVELADFMARRGKRVTVVGIQDVPFPGQPMPCLKLFLEDRLAKEGGLRVGANKYEWITENGITIINKQGQLQSIDGDTILFAGEYQPNTKLYQELSGLHCEVHTIGDCVQPTGILEALRDGWQVGRTI